MKIISKIRIFVDNLFGWGRDENNHRDHIDNPVYFPFNHEDNSDNSVNTPDLNIPPTLESGIVTPEPTKPLEFKPVDILNNESPDRNISFTTEIDEKTEKEAILSEKKFEELLEQICRAIEVFDKKADNFEKLSSDKVYKFIRSKLTDRLIQSGASIIKDEDSFDLLRHYPVEFYENTEEGCKISETIQPGIEYGGKVYLKAIVKLENI